MDPVFEYNTLEAELLELYGELNFMRSSRQVREATAKNCHEKTVCDRDFLKGMNRAYAEIIPRLKELRNGNEGLRTRTIPGMMSGSEAVPSLPHVASSDRVRMVVSRRLPVLLFEFMDTKTGRLMWSVEDAEPPHVCLSIHPSEEQAAEFAESRRLSVKAIIRESELWPENRDVPVHSIHCLKTGREISVTWEGYVRFDEKKTRAALGRFENEEERLYLELPLAPGATGAKQFMSVDDAREHGHDIARTIISDPVATFHHPPMKPDRLFASIW